MERQVGTSEVFDKSCDGEDSDLPGIYAGRRRKAREAWKVGKVWIKDEWLKEMKMGVASYKLI